MPKTLMTQDEMIRRHMDTVGSITCVEAQAVYRVRSLTSVMSRLRKAGMDIRSERKTDPMGQRYVRYHTV
jgi:hypothetical protein